MLPDSGTIRTILSTRVRREIHDPRLQAAAVLILLFNRDGEPHVLLTKRTHAVEHHKGQISFPGGAADTPGEESIATALREAHEEVGLSPDGLSVLGLFDDFQTPTGFCITPVVAAAEILPDLNPNPLEVEHLLLVPVRVFLDPANERTELRRLGTTDFNVYFYSFGPHEIWGATAAILRSLLQCLLPTAFAPSPSAELPAE